MDVVRVWRDVPQSFKGAVLAIGNFDGVHRGHQAVLGEALRIAQAESLRSGAVLFEPHPREFFEPEKPFFRLTPLPLKLELIEALGLDQVFVIDFENDLARLSAEAFATEVVGKAMTSLTAGAAPERPPSLPHSAGYSALVSTWLNQSAQARASFPRAASARSFARVKCGKRPSS